MADSNDLKKLEKQSDRIRILKHNLEGWREVLLPVNSLLMWERSYDPGVLVAIITTAFAAIWYFDPSVITTFSLLGIVVCIIDYLVPTLSANFFDPDKWTGNKERKYEQLCKGIISTWEHVENLQNSVTHLKTKKPKIYFVAVLFVLVFFAWLGNLMDNLLLTFLLVCLAVLFPGMKHHGILKRYLARLAVVISQTIGAQKAKKK